MLDRLRQHVGYANVMATVAVFVALGGSLYALATGSIGSRELKDNSIRSADLKDNNLCARDVRNDTLSSADIHTTR